MSFEQVVAPTPDASQIHPDLLAFLRYQADEGFVLGPALAQGEVLFSSVHAGPNDRSALMGALVDAIEAVRLRWRSLGQPGSAAAGAVIAITGPAADDPDWLMAMPHWIALNLYAPVGITISRETRIRPTDDDDEPVTPVPFFAIATSPGEPLSFLDDPDLAHLTPAAIDDRRDVLLPLLGEPTSGAAAQRRFPKLLRTYPLPGVTIIRDDTGRDRAMYAAARR